MAKIRLIISDFDGPLAPLKDVHAQTLNIALKTVGSEYCITPEQHISEFDGLSTRKKLEKLHLTRGLPKNKIEEVFALKQKLTEEAVAQLQYNPELVKTFSHLKGEGYLIYVASNAIKKTITDSLKRIGIDKIVDKVYSNEDVKFTKPHSEIYLKCMVDAGVNPDETLIIEDSPIGKMAAAKSGATICDVDSVADTNYYNIKKMIELAEQKSSPKFYGKNKINVLIPMSGGGTRFKQAGYELPKPLIDINGMPMIQWVVNNLNIEANFIFIVQKEHINKYNLSAILKSIAPGCKIVIADGLTEGAACSALLAKEFIDNDMHLLVANSDQFIYNFSISDFIYSATSNQVDASILTFQRHNDPKWSYAKVENGFVVEVAEKKPISGLATIGLYFWNKGSEFVKYTEQMINANDRTNNEFYVVPSFNWMIKDNKKIITHSVQPKDFWGLGTPEDLQSFIKYYDEYKELNNGSK